MRIKPATALPWNWARVEPGATSDAQEAYCPWFAGGGGPKPVQVGRSTCIQADDMRYIAHSANAYPKLVEALKEYASQPGGELANSVLVELGE